MSEPSNDDILYAERQATLEALTKHEQEFLALLELAKDNNGAS